MKENPKQNNSIENLVKEELKKFKKPNHLLWPQTSQQLLEVVEKLQKR